MSRNEAGGRDAADELHARIKDYMKKLKLDAENTDIAVQAYADLKSLRSACVKNGKMKESSSVSLFAHGFNQRQALFNFVDVGSGKKGADNKVRGTCTVQSLPNLAVISITIGRVSQLLHQHLGMQTRHPRYLPRLRLRILFRKVCGRYFDPKSHHAPPRRRNPS